MYAIGKTTDEGGNVIKVISCSDEDYFNKWSKFETYLAMKISPEKFKFLERDIRFPCPAEWWYAWEKIHIKSDPNELIKIQCEDMMSVKLAGNLGDQIIEIPEEENSYASVKSVCSTCIQFELCQKWQQYKKLPNIRSKGEWKKNNWPCLIYEKKQVIGE